MDSIGSRIKKAREKTDITQEQLGKMCGTTKQTIFKYESGIVTNIPMDRIEAISNALGVDPCTIMGWDDPKSQKCAKRTHTVLHVSPTDPTPGESEVVPTTLGDVISKYRNEHGLSMDKFAELSGISKAYISILERNRTPRGDEPSPSYEMYRSVAKAIGSDVDALIRAVEGNISLAGAKPALSVTPTPELTPDESELVRKYRRLDDAGKGRIRNALDYEYNSIPGSEANAAPKKA